jgi:hydroxymethylbilane synthase
MKPRLVVVATRKSELALAQCRQYLKKLSEIHAHLVIQELHVVTTGDKIIDRPLADIGGKGLFLKEIEETLLDKSADIAVHSMKDVPPSIHPDLMIGCIPLREDPRDAIVTTDGRPFMELRQGARLGTSSLRRGLQLKLLRPDLEVVAVRGNVGTRIRKCREGEVDATVLARAGLNRLGIQHEISETLSVEACLPAVGQGALAIQLRRDDGELLALVSALEHSDTALIVEAERGVMSAVDGDCKTPVAAFAERRAGELCLTALLAEPDGSRLRRKQLTVSFPSTKREAHDLGRGLGLELKASPGD